MIDPDLVALGITLQLAGLTTLALLVLGTPIAWWLARSRHWSAAIIEPLVALPIVLPPTVLGFYLLIAFSPQSLPGQLWQRATGEPLAFTFEGLLVGSIVYSLPFFVQPLQVAFAALPSGYLEAAATLGARPLERFRRVVVPLCRRGFIVAAALAFAHTLGEFGIVLMIGGNIPGETRVLSIALFDHVEALDYARAHVLAGGLLLFSFTVLFLVYRFNQTPPREPGL